MEAEVTEAEADAEDEKASGADVGGRGTVPFRHVPSVAVIYSGFRPAGARVLCVCVCLCVCVRARFFLAHAHAHAQAQAQAHTHTHAHALTTHTHTRTETTHIGTQG